MIDFKQWWNDLCQRWDWVQWHMNWTSDFFGILVFVTSGVLFSKYANREVIFSIFNRVESLIKKIRKDKTER